MRVRVLLAAVALTALTLAVLPTASAAPSALPNPVCVPPDGFQLWVCAGTWGTYQCVFARVGPPVHGVCVDPTQPSVVVCLFDDCIPVL